MIDLLDKKLSYCSSLPDAPAKGWVHAVRTAMRMSLRQLAERLHITAPSAHEIEKREREGTITLNALRAAASALNMKLVYGFVPVDGSLEKSIEKQALAVARKIQSRANQSMILEDQGLEPEDIEKSVREMAYEIKKEMPRYLWD
ncbi:MAG: mobile mystery protein A [Bacteroidia bacterium]|nr:mobile mystery protein A [Bacteroidia bacterium]